MISQCFTPYFHTPPISVRGAWPLWMRVQSFLDSRLRCGLGDVIEMHQHNGDFKEW